MKRKMKKLVILVCMLFASFAGYTQQNETALEGTEFASGNIGGFIFGNYCFQDKSVLEGISVSLMLYQNIIGNLDFRGSFSLTMFTAPENEPSLSFGVGLEHPIYKNLYSYVETFPSVSIQGVGHQINGDYIAVYFPVDLGLGYVILDKNDHCVYLECFVEKEFTAYYELGEMKRNGVNLGITLGYSYTFAKDVR